MTPAELTARGVRDRLFEMQRAAEGKLFTAHHHWAAQALHDKAPAKYREAAASFREFADYLDHYASAEAFPGVAALTTGENDD